ncbi:DUF3943 domain-containing protein [Flavitalea sp. BT771]|uniref:DUF3943 domain-containing protein n=1 Tax=Flavitalea sp. BT771 TaxID=3063329 RepID=UPI0026E31E7D|nr:DUF3943 domain-containing protein [Flavitalea sp. BT771]MDO6431513.1 DUF3943 domain-containing protein [Flavitalea sp. BT771]MDV6220421.1 DUF3943 domain-containing protein [Flavitalea sp. BT771]
MKHRFLLTLTFLYGLTHSSGQRQLMVQDSLVRAHHFQRAAATMLLAEAAPFLFDRYVANKDYARVSFSTIGYNLKPSNWTWDNDGFQTNQIGHPFHGSLFFNAFRSNGYSFWQSVPAAFAGSYIWETFSENQPPAPNDFINTGFGGAVLGEMTHRLTNRLLNNHSRGLNRQVNEILAMLINPSNGFTRLTNGQWGKPPITLTAEDSIPMGIELQAGLRKYNVNNTNPFRDGRFGLYGRIHLLYGDPFKYLRQPFSHLHITAEFGQDDSSKINIVSVYGSLTGWMIHSEKFRHVAVLSANYEYINNAAFFYSGQSIRMNLFSQFPVQRNFMIHTAIAAGPMILAAVPDHYLYKARDYDYGPGLTFSLSGGFTLAGRLFYNITYRGGWMHTTDGIATNYLLHAFTNEVSIRAIGNTFIVMESGYFNLHGNYNHYQTIDNTYPYLRLSVRCRLGSW